MPLVQVRQARAMALSETTDAKALMEANSGVYDIEQDPLWNGEQRSSAVPPAFGRKEMAFYQRDHLGTPQELMDHEGVVAWSAQYKAWGEAREAISEAGRRAGVRNPIRFQGQYFDEETGLHYNRYRYYDPVGGTFTSPDPIGLAGGGHLHVYVPSPTQWIDPLGLKYVSSGRSPTVVYGKDSSSKASTHQLSDWRRRICPSAIGAARDKFLGEEMVKVGPGKWRSVDGTRQFRVGPSDYAGGHGMGSPNVPNTPHVHFEFLSPKMNGGQPTGNFLATKNVHVPLGCP